MPVNDLDITLQPIMKLLVFNKYSILYFFKFSTSIFCPGSISFSNSIIRYYE